MSLTDPIADFLTRIRNACRSHKDEVTIPASMLKKSISQILKDEGYIEDFTLVPDKRQNMLVIQLKYDEDQRPVISGLKRESRPGRRIYVDVEHLPKVRNGLGTAIISTSKGIVTDKKARQDLVGGEYLCSVW